MIRDDIARRGSLVLEDDGELCRLDPDGGDRVTLGRFEGGRFVEARGQSVARAESAAFDRLADLWADAIPLGYH